MRTLAIAVSLLLIFSCDKGPSTAEKAGDAALRARKKAEQLKNDENKKTKETNDAMGTD